VQWPQIQRWRTAWRSADRWRCRPGLVLRDAIQGDGSAPPCWVARWVAYRTTVRRQRVALGRRDGRTVRKPGAADRPKVAPDLEEAGTGNCRPPKAAELSSPP